MHVALFALRFLARSSAELQEKDGAQIWFVVDISDGNVPRTIYISAAPT